MITKLTHSTRKMIRDAKRQPLKPGAPHTPGSQVPTLAPLFLCRMATPLVPDVSDTELSAKTADAFLLNEDDDESPRSRAILSEEITSQPSDSNVVVAGDRSRWAVFGSMLMIQASNENNGFYELSANPTYDEGSDETTFAFTGDLPNKFDLTGNLVRFGPWGLEARVTVRNLSGHMAICAMPGDDIICARVGRELLPICGPQTLCGQVVTTIAAPTIDVDDEDRAKDLRTLAEQTFGESPIVRYGRHPRLVMLYRGMQIRTSVGPVEFLSTGRQVVIFGQHPLTKKAYYYEDFSPLQYEPLDLPLINQHDVTKYRSLVQQYLPTTYKNGNGQPIGDTDFFDALKDARKATSAHERRLTICQQLQGGELGNLHNTLLSCIAALAKDNCSSERIKQIVEHNFNAPRTGPYSEDWRHMDQIIEKTVQKFGN